MLKIIVLAVLLLLVVFVAFSYWVSRPLFDEQWSPSTPKIAGREQALTFARNAKALIWVTGHGEDTVEGVDLTAALGEPDTRDLIALARSLSDERLGELADQKQSYSLAELVPPHDYAFPYVAAGTNFKEHAEEVYSDDPPFLFPKLARASGWSDPVPFVPRLDFEAELCLFPLEDIESPAALPDFGLVLCNDFTDRLTLVKELSLRKPLGQTGFANGKGCKGCLPTGYLVVIPRSPDFYRSLQLSLYVNGRLRQRFSMSDVILGIEEIVAQAFAKQSVPFQKGDEEISLLPQGKIPRGTLILTGTAAGVIFKPMNIWNQRLYLQPGDEVRVEASYLGSLRNVVAPMGAS